MRLNAPLSPSAPPPFISLSLCVCSPFALINNTTHYHFVEFDMRFLNSPVVSIKKETLFGDKIWKMSQRVNESP